MTTSLADLIAQRQAIDRQIQYTQRAAKLEAVALVKKLMAEHGLTAADVGASDKKVGVKRGAKIAAKYRDPVTGATWTGRGLKPKWLVAALADGKTPQDFAV